MSKTKSVKKVLSANEKKAIIIAAIAAVMIAVLVVSLVIVLKPKDNTEDPTTKPGSGSSSLYIKNGDFAYFENEGAYPKVASNWKTYTYSEPEENGDKQGFNEISADKVVMGVVDTSEDGWKEVATDLEKAGISATNPGTHNDDLDHNVYMIASKTATNAAIYSASFNVSPLTSAKITAWMNVSQIKSGNVTIMVQHYTSTPSALEKHWYAYDLELTAEDKTAAAANNGWISKDFFLFNRQTVDTETVVMTIGLGNIYKNEDAEGVLFIDDVAFETISANDYRLFVDRDKLGEKDSHYYAIGEDATVASENYATLAVYDKSGNYGYPAATAIKDYADSTLAKASDGNYYSPFTANDKFGYYSVTNDGSNSDPVALVLDTWNSNPIVVKSSDTEKDHLHVSFWVRLSRENAYAQANVLLQKQNGSDWDTLSNGSFKTIVTAQDISENSNCGWSKYDIYLKPTTKAATTLRVLFVLGEVDGYSATDEIPEGTLLVTQPFVEEITATEYGKKSGGTYAATVSLVGNTASTSYNGSFSSVVANNPNQPSNWQPVYAGYNVIYKDGKGNDEAILGKISATQDSASGMVVKNDEAGAPYYDDSEQNYLKITNNKSTCFGYLSNDMTLSAKTAYAISVLVKNDSDAAPHVYVVKNGAENRASAVLGSIEAKATGTLADDSKFCLVTEGNGWTRYYIVIVTGEESETVRVALFNGDLNGDHPATGTVYYDYVSMMTLGSYSIDTTIDEKAETQPALRERINYTASSGSSLFEKLTNDEIVAAKEYGNVSVSEPDWDTMIQKAVDEANKEEEPADTTPAEKQPVDLALLFSVISSVALVGALLIVVVIRMFKKRSQSAAA